MGSGCGRGMGRGRGMGFGYLNPSWTGSRPPIDPEAPGNEKRMLIDQVRNLKTALERLEGRLAELGDVDGSENS